MKKVIQKIMKKIMMKMGKKKIKIVRVILRKKMRTMIYNPKIVKLIHKILINNQTKRKIKLMEMIKIQVVNHLNHLQ